MFVQLWKAKLKEDTGIGQTMLNLVKQYAEQPTVASIVEMIAHRIQITDDPNALVNAFRQNTQKDSEPLQAYIFRKQMEARTVMLDGQ